MKIGIDARYMSEVPSGIGRYSQSMLEAMFAQAPEHDWHVLVHDSFRRDWPETAPPNLKLHRSGHLPVSIHTVKVLGEWVDAQGFDLWHSLFPVAPRCETPLVVTVHDLQPLQCPGWSGKRRWPLPMLYRQFYRWAYGNAVKRARHILVDSTWTGESVKRFWPSAAERLTTVPCGIDDTWIEKGLDESVPREPLVLFVGSTRPNKNLARLVRAFANLIAMPGVPEGLRLRLVLVKDRFWADIEAEIAALNLQERVQVVPPSDEASLRGEYQRAALLAFMTTHEGFGLPPLEAMACGCPVVAGDHGALRETCGESAVFADPFSVSSMADAMKKVLQEKSLQRDLLTSGREWIRKWKWGSSAALALRLYQDL